MTDTHDLYRRCTLCPRRCAVNREITHGFCAEGAVLRVARASLHFWEEPCLSGNAGSGTVFFSGCGLRCLYCQNRSIAHQNHGKEIDEQRLCDIFLELAAKGAANINLVTAVQFVPHIIPALDMAKHRGLTIPIVYNSSGYENVDTLRMLDGYIDIYLPDYKYWDRTLAARLSSAPDYPDIAKAAIDEMLRQTGEPRFCADGMMRRGVIVRHLVLPGHTEDSMKVLRRLWDAYGNRIFISIMNQYTPFGTFPDDPALSRRLTTYEYEKVLRFARALGITNGYIQTGDTARESFIPDFDGTGV